jgi:hypothetical protein
MLIAVVAAGCGGEPAGSSPTASFPAEPFQIITSVRAQFSVAIRAAPEQPPARGTNTIQYQVTDQMGAGVSGLAITVVPWMPAHGHGGSARPTVIDRGGGVYEAANVVLFMPGRWELRTTLAGRNTPEDSVIPAFDVQ